MYLKNVIFDFREKLNLLHAIEKLERDLTDFQDLYESLKKEISEINGRDEDRSISEMFAYNHNNESMLDVSSIMCEESRNGVIAQDGNKCNQVLQSDSLNAEFSDSLVVENGCDLESSVDEQTLLEIGSEEIDSEEKTKSPSKEIDGDDKTENIDSEPELEEKVCTPEIVKIVSSPTPEVVDNEKESEPPVADCFKDVDKDSKKEESSSDLKPTLEPVKKLNNEEKVESSQGETEKVDKLAKSKECDVIEEKEQCIETNVGSEMDKEVLNEEIEKNCEKSEHFEKCEVKGKTEETEEKKYEPVETNKDGVDTENKVEEKLKTEESSEKNIMLVESSEKVKVDEETVELVESTKPEAENIQNKNETKADDAQDGENSSPEATQL